MCPQRWKWQPTPVFLAGKFHGQGAWWATVHGVTKSWTRLSKLHFHNIWRCTFFLILTSLPIICNIKKKNTSFYQMNRLIMLRLRMFILDSDGEYLNVTLVLYYSVIYYHKLGSSNLISQKSSTLLLGFLFKLKSRWQQAVLLFGTRNAFSRSFLFLAESLPHSCHTKVFISCCLPTRKMWVDPGEKWDNWQCLDFQ